MPRPSSTAGKHIFLSSPALPKGRACLCCRKRRVRCDGEAPCRACKRTAHHEGRDESTIQCVYVVKGSRTAASSRASSVPVTAAGDQAVSATGTFSLPSQTSGESFDINNALIANFISTGSLEGFRPSAASSAASESINSYTSSLEEYASSFDSQSINYPTGPSTRWNDSTNQDFNITVESFAIRADQMAFDAPSQSNDLNLKAAATSPPKPPSLPYLTITAPAPSQPRARRLTVTLTSFKAPAYFDTIHHPHAPTTALVESLPSPRPVVLPSPISFHPPVFTSLLSPPSPALPLETKTTVATPSFSQLFDPFALDDIPMLTPGAMGLLNGISSPGWSSMDFSSWLSGPGVTSGGS